MFEHAQKAPGYPEGTVIVYFVTFTEIVILFPWYFTLSFVVPFACPVMTPFSTVAISSSSLDHTASSAMSIFD